ncbi:MAG: 5'-methylthioadenosine/S-adenosylhomocysteine nucleosidase [Bacilli bacterium]|nr:5'-methylthioadenosine/S-adenosylhomocysteine nucleosidase [Bacilli bacterium]
MKTYLYEMHHVRNEKRSKANALDCVISTKLCEHDLDTTPVGDLYGLISGINIIDIPSDTDLQKELGFAAKKANCNAVYAPISSGDQFISTAEQRQKIASHCNSLCYDMESAPMGQIAYVYKIKFSALRIISDCADSAEDYEKTCHMRQVCYQRY